MGLTRTAMLAVAVALPLVAGAGPGVPLVVESGRGRVRFDVEVAASPAARERGLMFRTEVPPGTGMLFLYPRPRVARMWMANTPVSLDMLFVRADGRIATIARDRTPLSREVTTSGEPVLGVLEIGGGEAERLGIAPGDRVIHPAFGPSQGRREGGRAP